MTDEQQSAPAGWYAHPTMADTQRYWDGTKWTDHVAPGQPTAKVEAEKEASRERSTNALGAAGIVMMIIFPIGGFIAGAMLLTRKTAAGVVIMILSVISAYVWYDAVFAPDPMDCYMDNIDRAQHGLPARDCE